MINFKNPLRALLIAGSLCGAVALSAGSAMAYTIDDYNYAIDQESVANMEADDWDNQAYNDSENAMMWDNLYQGWENQCGEDPNCVPMWEIERQATAASWQADIDQDNSFAAAARDEAEYWHSQAVLIAAALGL